MQEKAAADLGGAAQTRLDGVRAPGRVASQKMGVEIDKCAVPAREFGHKTDNELGPTASLVLDG